MILIDEEKTFEGVRGAAAGRGPMNAAIFRAQQRSLRADGPPCGRVNELNVQEIGINI
jgi:hypothetical protein